MSLQGIITILLLIMILATVSIWVVYNIEVPEKASDSQNNITELQEQINFLENNIKHCENQYRLLEKELE